ncbi:unnamed protein product [Urochloa humidicola]
MPPKGVTMSMLLSLGDSIFTTLPDMDQPSPDSDVDSEEFAREVQEYLDAFPCGSLRETFDRLKEIEHATLTTLVAEWGTEPPEPLQPPREPFADDQKAQSVQVPEEASTVAAHAQHSVVPRESRPEASMEETIPNGKIWMNKEVMLCFEKHVERSAHLMGLKEYWLDELLHQCFSVESYNKVYHHYNFTVKMKMPSSDDWVVELYFAEVKEMFGRKYYFCCPLEPDENGCCYACQSQGVDDLKHPAIGVFSTGSLDAQGFGLWYTDE